MKSQYSHARYITEGDSYKDWCTCPPPPPLSTYEFNKLHSQVTSGTEWSDDEQELADRAVREVEVSPEDQAEIDRRAEEIIRYRRAEDPEWYA